MRLDHVVLWVADPAGSLDFYERVLGLRPERRQEFLGGQAPFPSVRVSEHSIIDLMDRAGAPAVDAMASAPGTAGHPVNHVCLALEEPEFRGLLARLAEHGVGTSEIMRDSFGAQGLAKETVYFADPDGNVLEARHYG